MNYCFLHPFSFPPKSRKQVKPENSSDLGRSKTQGMEISVGLARKCQGERVAGRAVSSVGLKRR